MPGFSLLVTLLIGLGAWRVRSLSSRLIASGLIAGCAVTFAGLGMDAGWFRNLGLLIAALTLGVALGRVISPTFAPMLALLGVLSVADIIWIASGGGTSAGWAHDAANFSLQLGSTYSSIGTLDLVLAAALTTHWLRRDTQLPLAVSAAPIGMAFANVYVAAMGADNVALVPFITLGWLVTEGWYRLSGNP